MAYELDSSRPRHVRAQNIKSILTLFHRYRRLSVHEIIRHVPLSVTTARKIVIQLVEEGLLRSVGKGKSTSEGGKPPEWFEMNATYRYIVVCRFQDPVGVVALLDLHAEILREVPLYAPGEATMAYRETLRHMAERIEDKLIEWEIPPEQVFRVVLSCIGICHPDTGVLSRNPERLDDEGRRGAELPLMQDLERQLGGRIPVIIDSEDAFICYAEQSDPDNEDIHSLISLQNTGCCISIGGEMQRGYQGFVGFHTHTVLDPASNLVCGCGASGCFTVLTCERSLILYAQQMLDDCPDSPLAQKIRGGNIEASDIFAEADAGDALARRVIDRAVDWHIYKIYNLIVVYNPRKVSIQGLYRDAGSYFYKSLNERKAVFPHPEEAEPVLIAQAKHNRHFAELRGAGLYAFEKLFVDSFGLTRKE